MSDNSFTYGNILLLYCNFDKNNLIYDEKNEYTVNNDSNSLPDFIIQRINLCINSFNIIMKSKPDKYHTSIIIISSNNNEKIIKDRLIEAGITEQYIQIDTDSKTIDAVVNNVTNRIKKLTNPPVIYFIGSIWQKDTFDSISISKLRGYKVIFEGALDNRPFDIIQKEKLVEEPKKGSTYYKHKITDKAIDALLNHIFSNKRK